mmetsp:Transcript_20368/g.41949  ORF Transcript_20368/g.41949 Transcript_20368/m.41949 type:complete len:194 (-) Transcript_20368:76-657(-)
MDPEWNPNLRTELLGREDGWEYAIDRRVSYYERTLFVYAFFLMIWAVGFTAKVFGASHPLLIIYFLLNSFVSAIFLLIFKCRFPVVIPVYVLTLVLAVWSIPYIVIGVLYLHSIPEGEYRDKFDVRSTYLTGGLVSFFLSFFYYIELYCLSQSRQRRQEAERSHDGLIHNFRTNGTTKSIYNPTRLRTRIEKG